jgi:hypothetical protein
MTPVETGGTVYGVGTSVALATTGIYNTELSSSRLRVHRREGAPLNDHITEKKIQDLLLNFRDASFEKVDVPSGVCRVQTARLHGKFSTEGGGCTRLRTSARLRVTPLNDWTR